ncbi:MAG: AAA family ATPase, partial [Cyclobacteriaceae bacterium]
EISLSDFELPNTINDLVVEGAGGILVPLNNTNTMADLMKQLNIPVILVSNLYLGNINHTLLSYEYLKKADIPLYGIVFNGPPNAASEEVILKMTGLPVLLRIMQEEEVTPAVVLKYADKLRENLQNFN